MANFWRVVNEVIERADVLLLVLDSRLVDETRNSEIENKIRKMKKSLIFVMNKADLVNKDDLEKKKKQFPDCVFVSAKEGFGKTMLRNKIKETARRNGIKTPKIFVGVLGYPNVGKSSLINSLKGKSSAKTSIMSGYTKGLQKVRVDGEIIMLDTPGVIPYQEKDMMKHSFIGTIDFVHCKEPDLVVMELMEKFPGKIEKYYGIEVQEDKEEEIEEIAHKINILKKGGIPDVVRASRMILKDWQKGDIR